MYNKILVAMALDHDLSPKTLRIAEALRKEGGEIIALHVHEAPHGTASVYLDEEVVKAAYTQSEALLKQKLQGLYNITPVITKGHAARTIIDYAAANGVDCIVIGSHKPGLSDYFLGSSASRVVRHAPCAVHVQRDDS
ncbi:Universal stress protein G [Roseovarius albus]|uniref:Universal stress protein G n=1 Tax=Roseovarius albus TaxID=1247867 RepID=A0A1X6YUE2_9RHOB|nr:universal stress protein [Roseovarius albus]SLN31508.1 Universal stress protein G [Roseovarius albus]